MLLIRPLIVFFTIINFAVAAQTSPSELVELGIVKYKSGDYDSAVTLFKEALVLLPDDQLVAYNLGCAYVMQDNFDNAAEQLRLAAAGRDTKIAALARGLSAEIRIRHARSLLASPPEATAPDVREKVMRLIDDAESWYTEIIELAPNNDSARGNLERLRTWRVQTRNDWRRVDRSSLRRSDSAKYLDEVCRELSESRNDTRNSITQPDSPKKFQLLYQNSKNVTELADELQSFAIEQPQTKSPDATNPFYIPDVDDNERKSVREKAGELAANLETAVKPLKLFQPENAVQTLTNSLVTANNLQATISSYEPLLRNTIERQTTLLKDNNTNNPTTADTPSSEEQSFEQQLTSRLIPPLLSKSRTFLRQWKPDEQQPNDSQTNHDTANPLSEKNRRLAESMLLLQKNATELEYCMSNAVNELAASNSTAAAPHQQRALQLLQEILQPLNEQNESGNSGSQNDRDNKDEDDSKNNGDKKSQEESKKEEQSDKEKQNEQESEQKNKQQNQSNQNQNEPPQNSPGEQQSKEQAAERMIRQMQRRQQEADEGREKIKSLLRILTPVEKDW
ncbi:MAG: tetratricopeptide repeat protein [Planctomycetaceae bacterium]|jgi:hypothetical protein|nr:tetratricopeptide repeat protein [Planctomycetaceae bacterium]